MSTTSKVVLAVVGVVGVGLAAATVALLSGTENTTVVVAPSPAGAPSERAADEVTAGPGDTFPTVRATDLNGDAVALPAGLPGESTVVLLSWDRAGQDPVDAWIAALDVVEAELPGTDHVQLAITAGTDAATRGAVTFFMGRAITDPAARARTIPLFTDPDAFAGYVGLAAPSVVDVLLVRDGTIAWRHAGPHSEDAEAALRAALTAEG